MRLLIIFALAMVMLHTNIQQAQAACSSPAGVEADIRYDSTAKMMYFCDGSSWIPTANLGNDWDIVSLTNTSNWDTRCMYWLYAGAGNSYLASRVTTNYLFFDTHWSGRSLLIPKDDRSNTDLYDSSPVLVTDDYGAVTEIRRKCH